MLVPDDIGPDDDVFVDAEDSMITEETRATPRFKELCSTPKCDYKGSRQFQEQPVGSILFPGRLQRIFIEG
jgi:hypothetical protein